MAFDSFAKKPEYDVDELLSQIEQYRDAHGEECEYVKCEHRNADYSVLDRQQKEYYLYWRDELSHGVCLKSDRGYVKLRLCEIINDRADPKARMDELRLLFDSTRMHGVPQSEIAMAMFDYSIANDLDLPIMWMGKGSFRSFMVTSELMSFPVKRVGKELAWYLSGGPRIHADGVDNLKHIRLFNDCLREIDFFLHENTGKGIALTYSEGQATELYKVFAYLPYGGNKDYQITYERLRADGIFGEFMLGLFTYTRKILCKEIGEKGPSTPSSFNKEFRKIVERVAKEGPSEHDPVIGAPRGTLRTSMSSKERALVDMGMSLERQYGTAEKPKAVLNVDSDAPKQHVSPHLKNDIERNWNVEVAEKQEYIPSGFTNPDYRSFNDAQRKFYIYWRNRARKGIYGETDAGYLWLYLCEIINIKEEPAEMMKCLLGLREAYGYADTENVIGHACFDYALVHKLPIPYPSIYESNVTACLVMDQFLAGKDTKLDKEQLLFLSETKDKAMVKDLDDDCVGITGLFLRKAEEKLASEGSSIKEHCSLERSVESLPVYVGLKYFKDIRKARAEFNNYIYNASFDDSLKAILKAAFSVVRLKRTNRPIKVAKFTAFGMDGKDMMAECAEEWFEGKKISEIKEIASSMELDRDAIEGAQSALSDVTRMMKVDYGEQDAPVPGSETEPEPVVSSTSDDPWKDLRDRLDKVQLGYLEACLSGKAIAYLKEHRTTMTKMDDSINAAAMDTVKDTILEDGTVFEDYADPVRAILER